MDCYKYQTDGFFDELFEADGKPYSYAKPLIDYINSLSERGLYKRKKAAELSLFNQGITFNVYSDKQGTEKILPFDIIPRIVPKKDWDIIESGLKQRITALNHFIQDIYNDKKIIKDNLIPAETIYTSPGYLQQCEGLSPPLGVWTHISGSDLVRDNTGKYYVLEDNLRCPSGISYVLQNREMEKQTLANVFKQLSIRPVSNYGHKLYETLKATTDTRNPNVIILTPGRYNAAYFEHTFLAKQMGVKLAESSDLIVKDEYLMLKTTAGLEKVDVVYRRIDDDYIDPTVFREDSLLGIPGIFNVYRKGNVVLVNAPGTGVADDKAIYPYIEKIIQYYLGQDPIISNVPTYLCSNKDDLSYVIDNIETLVVKERNLSGGYGMLIGPKATKSEIEKFVKKIKKEPHTYIAQPTLALSRCPTLTGNSIEGRHVDLRPYILYGKDIFVLPGGLTRVALTKNSLVVNSSQGGGSKDTWVLNN